MKLGSPAPGSWEAMTSGQLQALLPSAIDAAPGAESFKKGPITVVDLVTQIEKTAPEVGLAYCFFFFFKGGGEGKGELCGNLFLLR